jgi:hypothetical protein
MVSEQSYNHIWQEMVAVGHPFLAVGGLKDVPGAPVRDHVTPFNTAGHLPVARGGHSCSTPGALRAHTSNRSHVAEEKSYWRWKIAERCQLRRRTATVRLLCDAFFLTARCRHSENFNEKLKLAGALNGAPAA